MNIILDQHILINFYELFSTYYIKWTWIFLHYLHK
jgi:hypothetical protein